MRSSVPQFVFEISSFTLDEAEDFVVRVPPGLGTRKMLFDVLRRELRLPDYFGDNWDALFDCVRDLSWIGERRVIILHEDLPQLDAETLSTYLDVLSECIQDWKAREDHELVVIFPKHVQEKVLALINQQEKDGQE